MLTIGCHMSVAKGFEKMGLTAVKIGANTVSYTHLTLPTICSV